MVILSPTLTVSASASEALAFSTPLTLIVQSPYLPPFSAMRSVRSDVSNSAEAVVLEAGIVKA